MKSTIYCVGLLSLLLVGCGATSTFRSEKSQLEKQLKNWETRYLRETKFPLYNPLNQEKRKLLEISLGEMERSHQSPVGIKVFSTEEVSIDYLKGLVATLAPARKGYYADLFIPMSASERFYQRTVHGSLSLFGGGSWVNQMPNDFPSEGLEEFCKRNIRK